MKITKIAFWVAIFALQGCGQTPTGENSSNNSDSLEQSTSQTAPTPPTEQPLDTLVKGVDVSSDQGDVDWVKAKSAGVDFMYALCSKGKEKLDAKFTQNWEGAKQAGIQRGAIHQYRFGTDPIQQANYFKQAVKPSAGDLRPVIRIDGGSLPPNVRLNPSEASKDILRCLKEIETLFGCKPILFTTKSSGNNYLNEKAFASYPIWIASLLPEPVLPDAWKEGSWTLWMNSEPMALEGFAKPVQQSRFHATSVEFAKEVGCSRE